MEKIMAEEQVADGMVRGRRPENRSKQKSVICRRKSKSVGMMQLRIFL
ncbi:hypothetical protein [Lihuaxuella thermophila]|uniref:Uncharacterized protein n=1 Tax=Lihuaxuella thermophila TaxID=1173111 RepID=A0A1H8GM78_9BACL|nr:hypothetical protein [Lihuaxuella thermophila]SEN44844.1 hypothetical protein SAMN05444955_111126 [Lihuaxuella thermophila]